MSQKFKKFISHRVSSDKQRDGKLKSLVVSHLQVKSKHKMLVLNIILAEEG